MDQARTVEKRSYVRATARPRGPAIALWQELACLRPEVFQPVFSEAQTPEHEQPAAGYCFFVSGLMRKKPGGPILTDEAGVQRRSVSLITAAVYGKLGSVAPGL